MFLMFTLRRPDILPVGDLGVQKGLLKWVLAAYEHDLPTPASNVGRAEEAQVDSSVLPVDTPVPVPAPVDVVLSPTKTSKQKKQEQKALEKALLGFGTPPDDLETMFPLPEGMDVKLMRSRLSGKKAK